jgi:hypothetical protein
MHSALRPLDMEALREDSIRWVPIGSFMVGEKRVHPDGLIRVSRGSPEANVSRRARRPRVRRGALLALAHRPAVPYELFLTLCF